MVLLLLWCAPKGHDAFADELVHCAAFGLYPTGSSWKALERFYKVRSSAFAPMNAIVSFSSGSGL